MFGLGLGFFSFLYFIFIFSSKTLSPKKTKTDKGEIVHFEFGEGAPRALPAQTLAPPTSPRAPQDTVWKTLLVQLPLLSDETEPQLARGPQSMVGRARPDPTAQHLTLSHPYRKEAGPHTSWSLSLRGS